MIDNVTADKTNEVTALVAQHVADIVELLNARSTQDASKLLGALPLERAIDVFDQPGLEKPAVLMQALPVDRAVAVLSGMSADRMAASCPCRVAMKFSSKWSLWVNRVGFAMSAICPVVPQWPSSFAVPRTVEKGHERTHALQQNRGDLAISRLSRVVRGIVKWRNHVVSSCPLQTSWADGVIRRAISSPTAGHGRSQHRQAESFHFLFA